MKYVAGFLVLILVVSALSYGAWRVARWWNYSWGYESQVQATVCEMVKTEALKDPTQCN